MKLFSTLSSSIISLLGDWCRSFAWYSMLSLWRLGWRQLSSSPYRTWQKRAAHRSSSFNYCMFWPKRFVGTRTFTAKMDVSFGIVMVHAWTMCKVSSPWTIARHVNARLQLRLAVQLTTDIVADSSTIFVHGHWSFSVIMICESLCCILQAVANWSYIRDGSDFLCLMVLF